MSNLLKQQFRATYGLDAGLNKVINVAKADRTVMSDGVNVEYLIQENTIQPYDSTRSYLKGFAVTFEKRIWVANRDIAKPAGTFNQVQWESLRVDPQWIYVNNGSINLESGQYINADSRANELAFTLPPTPQDGDTVVVRDIGGQPGYNGINIIASNQSIAFNNLQLRNLPMTRPFSMLMFTFTNRLWQTTLTDLTSVGKMVFPGTEIKVQVGEDIIPRYTTNTPVVIRLPKYANTNDTIRLTDLDGNNPLYHLQINTFDENSFVGNLGQNKVELRTKGNGFLIYDDSDKIWRIFQNDLQERVRIIKDDVTLMPNESVMVFGNNFASNKTVNINLPTSVAVGDKITIALNYIRKGQIVNINPVKGDTIATSKNLLQFPKRSSYPTADWVSLTQLSFDGGSDYVPVIELSYVEEGAKKFWLVASNNPTVERVDSGSDATRARLGVIALATQAQANVDYENGPQKELAITPETLANRYATETRRGIARIATTSQVNQDTTFAFADDLIISPKKLNERTATETRRGVAEIATQTETNGSTDDITIVTPKKLHNRKASPTLTGILALVSTGGTPSKTERETAGTNIYNHGDYEKAVTPKTLREFKATTLSAGISWLATDAEVRNGTDATDGYPTVVTPSALHKKTANETQIGLIELATQQETDAGTDDLRAITPKKLNNRKASYTLTGIARFANADEFEKGDSDVLLVNPINLRTKLSDINRITVNSASGLVITGNFWDHYNIDIQKATTTQNGTTTLATQTEVNAGTEGTKIVTSATLAAKKATETADGIVRIANQSETVTGTEANKAVSPKNLKYVVQNESTWQATDTVRGFVKLSKGEGTWKGTDVNGSTLPDNGYADKGVAVSPYEMNLTLKHYLPLLGKAADSLLLDGVASSSWARRDIDQSITGAYTFSKDTRVNAKLTVNGIIESINGEIKTVAINASNSAHFRILNSDQSERAIFYAEGNNSGNAKIRVASSAVFTFDKNGGFNATGLLSSSTLSTVSTASVGGVLNVGGATAIRKESSGLIVNSAVNPLVLQSNDASNILATESSASYKVLTEKNAQNIINANYVRRDGTTPMSGRLTVNNAASIIGQSGWADLAAPNASSVGTWSAEISNSAQYNKLPGYAVPVLTQDPLNPDIQIVTSYNYVKAPGTLSQFGVGTNYSYQIWTPRATSKSGDNPLAQTFWIRQMNPITGSFDDWGRMYTSNNPPTTGEIGATSAVGTTVKNMTVTDWFKIGKIKIYPDEATQTVKFEWIG